MRQNTVYMKDPATLDHAYYIRRLKLSKTGKGIEGIAYYSPAQSNVIQKVKRGAHWYYRDCPGTA